MRYISFFLFFLVLASCKDKQPALEYLGVVNIEISGKQKAIPHFEKGLLLLHSFEYEDARDAFKSAQEIDPSMPMAYWGEAMTYNHSLWSEQNYDDGLTVLAKLKDIDLDQKATELERDFIESIHILYEPKKEKADRDQAYSDFMKGLAQKYPANHEVAAFYAISLLAVAPQERNETRYEAGAEIAQRIIQENPNHPGALHYLIHSYDDPNHASLALDAANAYAKVAPDASHALHMPSHIYAALGMWDEVISSNINSYGASVTRKERKKMDNDALGYHAYHWLAYGYLQKENRDEAKQMVINMTQFASEKPSKRARVHNVFLKGTYLVETNDWLGEIADIVVDVSDLNISIRSQYQFLDGMIAYKKGDRAALELIINKMAQDEDRSNFVLTNGAAKLCSNVARDEVSERDITESQIRQFQLRGLAATLDENMELAEEYLLKSIELESSISYSYGPPFIQKPTDELYADWLVSQENHEAAKAYYKKCLDNRPNRLLSLKGMEQTNM
jgi:tetratricopeptide (TPR) repeat protein